MAEKSGSSLSVPGILSGGERAVANPLAFTGGRDQGTRIDLGRDLPLPLPGSPALPTPPVFRPHSASEGWPSCMSGALAQGVVNPEPRAARSATSWSIYS